MNIEQIDKNFAASSVLGLTDLVYYPVRQQPFQLYGLYQPYTQPAFMRMNPTVAEKVNNGVKTLNTNTAGGRVRFSTDSDYIAIRATMRECGKSATMAITGSRGFDLYEDFADAQSVYRGTFRPNYEPDKNGNASYESVVHFADRRKRFFTINFPLYHNVEDLAIGVCDNATVGEGASYRNIKPIVFYGSSITQGGCASRPGNAYPAMISRALNCDYANYGFSGSAKGEPEMIRYLAEQEASVFVLDYDHNTPTTAHLAATHQNVYRILRAAQPNLPIIMVSRPSDYNNPRQYDTMYPRRGIVFRTFTEAFEAGDRNVAFVDGEALFAGLPRGECTVDDYHPNDLGFYGMARVIGEAIARFLP